jgi:hypothetical protein
LPELSLGQADPKLLESAGRHCEEQKRTMHPVSFKATGRPRPAGGWLAPSWNPLEAELVFQCLALPSSHQQAYKHKNPIVEQR